MDTFTFLTALVLILISIQFQQGWIAFGIIALLIVATKSISASLLLIFATALLYLIQGTGKDTVWPIVLFGLVIMAFLLGMTPKAAEPEFYSPDSGFGGGGGGMGGYGGLMGGGY